MKYSANKPDPYAQINPRTGQLFGEIPCSVPHIPREVVPKSTCDFCGEEVLCSDLDEFNACPDCHQEPQASEAPELCSSCKGSGQGIYPNKTCWDCKGRGTL